MRAKINASIPGYTPAGFRFEGPIAYQNGTVLMSFKANGDNERTYTIMQQASNWNSDSLAANIIPASSQVQTSQVKGTTVYIYGDSNDATWVNNGIRYSIKDSAKLNSDQLIKIADSL